MTYNQDGVGMTGGHDIAMALRAAYWAMHREADLLLKPYGITADQFVLMSIIAECELPTQRELVRRASSDPNTVRAMLLLLERGALVVRRPHETDNRSRRVSLTDKGRKMYTKLWKKSQVFHERLLDAIGRPTATTFVQQLRSLETLRASQQGSASEADAAAGRFNRS